MINELTTHNVICFASGLILVAAVVGVPRALVCADNVVPGNVAALRGAFL
jgi:hypothetical protein